jgi:hypothetical protein
MQIDFRLLITCHGRLSITPAPRAATHLIQVGRPGMRRKGMGRTN